MKRPRYGWALVLLLVGVGAAIWPATQAPRVRIATAERMRLAADWTATGFVEARDVTISAKVTGRVASVRVDEGDSVRRGELLLVLEPSELGDVERSARAAQRSAEANARAAALDARAAKDEAPDQVRQAQAVLMEARAQLDRLEHGARPEEIREARATREQAEAGVRLARAQLAAAETARAQQEHLSQAQIRRAEAALAAARAADEQVRAGPRPQEVAQLEAALRDAEARRELAEKEFDRVAALHAGGALSRQQVDQAQSAREVSRQGEAQARLRLSLAREGSRREEREASRAQVEAADAQRGEALAAAEQVRQREREVEAARQQLAQAESLRQAAAARARLVEQGPRSEEIAAARAQVARAEAALRQARSALLRVDVRSQQGRAARAQADQAAAQADQATTQRRETLIRSPIDGTVARRLVDPGELVTPTSPFLPGTELLRLVDPRRRWVMAEVDAEDLGKVRAGQAVQITSEAYPGPYSGRVAAIGPTAEPKPGGRTRARIVRVKVGLSAAPPELKPGLEVDVRARTTLAEGALLIPNDALLNDREPAVFVVSGDRIARRPIRVGHRNDLTIEVTEGLREGDRVVVRGKEGLRDGARVRVEP